MLGKPITEHITISNFRNFEYCPLLGSKLNVFGTGPCEVYENEGWVYIYDPNYIVPLVWRIHLQDWIATDKSGM